MLSEFHCPYRLGKAIPVKPHGFVRRRYTACYIVSYTTIVPYVEYDLYVVGMQTLLFEKFVHTLEYTACTQKCFPCMKVGALLKLT
jgi:hypothetical protein